METASARHAWAARRVALVAATVVLWAAGCRRGGPSGSPPGPPRPQTPAVAQAPGSLSAVRQAPTSPFAVPQYPALEELMQTEAAPAPEPDTGFRIYLTLDKLEFLPEEPFFATITFANAGPKPLRFGDRPSPEYGLVGYELVNSAGQRCGVWKAIGEVAWDAVTGRVLQPGGRYSACIDLSTQARISLRGAAPPSPFSSSPLWKPGEYALTAAYHPVPARPEFGGPLRSNTVSLEVLDLTGRPAADQGAYGVLSEVRREGDMWVKLGDEAEAYTRVLRDFPTSGYAAWCGLNLGESLGAAKRYAAAAVEYRAVLGELPGTRQAVQAQWRLGMALYRDRKNQQAVAAFRALEEAPAVPDAQREDAAFYRDRAQKRIFD